MPSILFSYHHSDAVVQSHFINTGEVLNTLTHAKFDTTEMTPTQRNRLIAINGRVPIMNMTIQLQSFEVEEKKWYSNPYNVHIDYIKLDAPPSLDECLSYWENGKVQKEQVKAMVDEMNQQHLKQLAEEATPAAKTKQLEPIEWKDGYAIFNLFEHAFAAAGLARDDRFSNWVKEVNTIDETQKGVYCFEGEFVNDSTHKIAQKRQLYLVYSELGSRKNRTGHYVFVILEDGVFKNTGIADTDEDRGWYLKVIDQVRELL
jgi:hypothetical protein